MIFTRRHLLSCSTAAATVGWAGEVAAQPLTAEADHARLLGLLNIDALRPGVRLVEEIRSGSDDVPLSAISQTMPFSLIRRQSDGPPNGA